MRLIDADENRENFMETVYEILADEPDNIKANLIIDAFDSMEVAYDADAVVRELEKEMKSTYAMFEKYGLSSFWREAYAFVESIKIVKRGGRDDCV